MKATITIWQDAREKIAKWAVTVHRPGLSSRTTRFKTRPEAALFASREA